MDYFLILFSCVGLTQILMYGTILNRPRNFLKRITFFKELLDCALCTGTWVGALHSIILYANTLKWDVNLIFIVFASSGFCLLIELLMKYLESHSNH